MKLRVLFDQRREPSGVWPIHHTMEIRRTFEGRARLGVGSSIGRLDGRSALEKELAAVVKSLGRNASHSCLVDIGHFLYPSGTWYCAGCRLAAVPMCMARACACMSRAPGAASAMRHDAAPASWSRALRRCAARAPPRCVFPRRVGAAGHAPGPLCHWGPAWRAFRARRRYRLRSRVEAGAAGCPQGRLGSVDHPVQAAGEGANMVTDGARCRVLVELLPVHPALCPAIVEFSMGVRRSVSSTWPRARWRSAFSAKSRASASESKVA